VADDEKYEKQDAPPPPLFLNQPERDFTKQISDEIVERVIGQDVFYFSLDVKASDYHELYGEAIVKTYKPPVHVKLRAEFDEESTTGKFGIDRRPKLLLYFHKRRVNEDQNMVVKEGDVVRYGESFFEITELIEERELFGQNEFRFEVRATCSKLRDGAFNGR